MMATAQKPPETAPAASEVQVVVCLRGSEEAVERALEALVQPGLTATLPRWLQPVLEAN